MKDIVIFDLDGTLANIEHRLHHLRVPSGMHEENIKRNPPNWKSFFADCVNDTPVHEVQMVYELFRLRQGRTDYAKLFEVWIASGRSDEVREQTEKWLCKHLIYMPHKLLMRKAGDHQPDTALKRSWLLDGTIPKDRVLCVFDDRKSVVDMWRSEGLKCFQVAEGDF